MKLDIHNGSLYRGFKVVREDYARHHKTINSTIELKSTLRAGQFAWPGGYPLFLITDDGEAICFECAIAEYRLIADSIMRQANDGWRVVACDINYEDNECHCCNCYKQIKPAYGE